VNPQWPLPEYDYWSTPFAEALMSHLELFPGATVLDVAAGSGIPAFHIAEQVGPEGQVLAVDIHQHQILRSRSSQGRHMPWLKFEVGDMRQLPPDLPRFDRITGNLSFMFFRQIVLTFPSLGTFDSLWDQVDRAMAERGYENERKALVEYIEERPSADDAKRWLEELNMERVKVTNYPLEIATGPGRAFLEHPLLRGGFLDDVYECFKDQTLAEEFMTAISNNIESFTPLYAQRCAMSGWSPKS
jgi:ubiquinone/menaquinone biosynthesis C-methylase UbiE